MSTSRSATFAMTPFDGSTEIYKRHSKHFCDSFHRFRDINVKKCVTLRKCGSSSRSTTFAWRHSTLTIELYKFSYHEFLRVALVVSGKLVFKDCWPWHCKEICDFLLVGSCNMCRYRSPFSRYSPFKQHARSLTLKMKIKVKKEKNA